MTPKAPEELKPAPAHEKPKSETNADEEIGGRGGLDPARYGDWEIGGKCVDF